ncbi:MAG: hypothetical protein LAO06_03405 [Acidobacteriia bacterium]|nr:hypothetical protein [Terriglobia bacterium]
MATNPESSAQKKTKLDEFAAEVIAEINRRAERMSPEERAEAHRKTLELAARVRTQR